MINLCTMSIEKTTVNHTLWPGIGPTLRPDSRSLWGLTKLRVGCSRAVEPGLKMFINSLIYFY